MKLIIIHGNGLVGALNKISQIKKEFANLEVNEIDFKNSNAGNLLIDLATPQLFSTNRLVIVSNVETDFDLTAIPAGDPNLTLVLRFSKTLTAASKILKLSKTFQAQVIEISEPSDSSIFPFLDKLAEKKVSALADFEKLYQNYGSQYLLTMIAFMLRRFIVTPKNLPPFVLKKIDAQKKAFPENKIKQAYLQVLETDYKIKNGLADEKIALSLMLTKIIDS